jgi:hypothetical protein
VVQLNRDLGEPQAVEVLCHEWAHSLARNFTLDRLSKIRGLDPVEFNRACHDEAWDSSLFAGLAGISGGHPAGGMTAVQWALGTVSKTVSKRPLGA